LAKDLIMSEQNETGFWPAFLPEIEKAIETALSAVAAQEQTLTALALSQTAEAGTRLESIRDRIFGLKACVDRPEQAIAEFEGTLHTSENQVRTYLQEIDGIRQRLADWAGGAVG
jgi:hypothetical protein